MFNVYKVKIFIFITWALNLQSISFPFVSTVLYTEGAPLMKHEMCLLFNIARISGPWQMYFMAIFTAFNCVLYLIICVLYTAVAHLLHQKIKGSNISHMNNFLYYKVVAKTLVVSLLNVVCWIPMMIFVILSWHNRYLNYQVWVWFGILIMPFQTILSTTFICKAVLSYSY